MRDVAVLAAQQAAQQAVARDNAARVLRPGTVVEADPVTCICTVLMDGDTESIDVLNACGGFLWAGDRALVQFQPPHGAYAVFPLQPLDPMFIRLGGTAATIASGTLTALPLDTATVVGHPEQFTVTATTVRVAYPSRYLISATVAFAVNTTGHRLVELFTNGANRFVGDTRAPADVETDVPVEWRQDFDAGDSFQIRARQTSGAGLSTTLTRLHVEQVARA